MINTPLFLQDANELLSENGFVTGNIWYHGTSSALLASINEQGLKRSGDKELNEAAKATMATLGNSFTETPEPIFLSQSKELAFYWAEQTVRERQVRFGENEQPVVLSIQLPEEQLSQVQPDVGAMSLLMMEVGEKFMAHLAAIYKKNNIDGPKIDLRNADRMDYLSQLGMAYYNADINAERIDFLSE